MVSNKLMALRAVLLVFLFVVNATGQKIDYGTQLKGQPIYTDATPNSSTLATLCTTAGVATVAITRTWTINTQTVACPLQFNGGYIKPNSGQTVTFTVAGWNGNKVCDLSLGGSCIIYTASGSVYPRMWGAAGDGTTNDSAAITAALAGTGSYDVDFEGRSYATTTAIPVGLSNQRIHNFRMVTNRAAPAVTNSYESSTFYYSGDINQKNVTIEDGEISGTGYWSGIESSVIYFLDGWNGGSPVPNALNYAGRKNMTIRNITFTNPYYEAVFTTNVQTLMYNLRADGCQNVDLVGCFYTRAATDIVYDGIKVIEGYDKAVSSAYINRAKYNNIQAVNLTVLGGAIYVGYFNQDTNVTNCSVQLTNADPNAGFFKASYYAQRTSVTGCTFIGTGYVYFQGAKDFTFTGNVIKTSGLVAFKTTYHNIFGVSQNPQGGVITGNSIMGCLLAGCSTVLTTSAPKIVTLDDCQNCIFSGNNVIGNIVANPGYDIAVTGNMVDFSPTGYLTHIPAVYLQALTAARVDGNRIRSGWTDGTPTVALSTTLDVGILSFTNNEFTIPTDSANYGVSASAAVGDAASSFRYNGNKVLNISSTIKTGNQYELGIARFAFTDVQFAYPFMEGLSTSIGGGALAAGNCATDTAVTVTGAITSMNATATPTTQPGGSFFYRAWVSATNTATVQVCAAVAGTPTASVYRVIVQPRRP